MKKLVLVFAAAALTVGLAVTGALAKTAKKSASDAGLRPDAGHQDVGPLGAVRRAVAGQGASRRPASRTSIDNSQGDPQKQKAQADQCIVERREGPDHRPDRLGLRCGDREGRAAKGVKSIDYDRQVEGGVASLYVSFDNHTVGVAAGPGTSSPALKANGKYSQAAGRRRV